MYENGLDFSIGGSVDRKRQRRVVFYGRVSTEHEAQLAALENQMNGMTIRLIIMTIGQS